MARVERSVEDTATSFEILEGDTLGLDYIEANDDHDSLHDFTLADDSSSLMSSGFANSPVPPRNIPPSTSPPPLTFAASAPSIEGTNAASVSSLTTLMAANHLSGGALRVEGGQAKSPASSSSISTSATKGGVPMVQSTPIVSSDGASGTVVGTIDSGGGVCSYVDIIKETNETNSTSGERPSGSGDTKIGRKAGMAESKRWGYGDASALFASASSAAAGGSTFDASALRRELVQRDTVIAELAGGAAQQAQEAEQEIMALRQALESAETAVTILQEARFGNDDNNNNYDRGQMMAVSIDGAAAAAMEAAAERRAAAVVAERVAERTSSLEEALEQNQLAAAVAEAEQAARDAAVQDKHAEMEGRLAAAATESERLALRVAALEKENLKVYQQALAAQAQAKMSQTTAQRKSRDDAEDNNLPSGGTDTDDGGNFDYDSDEEEDNAERKKKKKEQSSIAPRGRTVGGRRSPRPVGNRTGATRDSIVGGVNDGRSIHHQATIADPSPSVDPITRMISQLPASERTAHLLSELGAAQERAREKDSALRSAVEEKAALRRAVVALEAQVADLSSSSSSSSSLLSSFHKEQLIGSGTGAPLAGSLSSASVSSAGAHRSRGGGGSGGGGGGDADGGAYVNLRFADGPLDGPPEEVVELLRAVLAARNGEIAALKEELVEATKDADLLRTLNEMDELTMSTRTTLTKPSASTSASPLSSPSQTKATAAKALTEVEAAQRALAAAEAAAAEAAADAAVRASADARKVEELEDALKESQIELQWQAARLHELQKHLYEQHQQEREREKDARSGRTSPSLSSLPSSLSSTATSVGEPSLPPSMTALRRQLDETKLLLERERASSMGMKGVHASPPVIESLSSSSSILSSLLSFPVSLSASFLFVLLERLSALLLDWFDISRVSKDSNKAQNSNDNGGEEDSKKMHSAECVRRVRQFWTVRRGAALVLVAWGLPTMGRGLLWILSRVPLVGHAVELLGVGAGGFSGVEEISHRYHDDNSRCGNSGNSGGDATFVAVFLPPLRGAAMLIQACSLWECASFVGTMHHRHEKEEEEEEHDDDSNQQQEQQDQVRGDQGSASPTNVTNSGERAANASSSSSSSSSDCCSTYGRALRRFLRESLTGVDPKFLTVGATIIKVGVTAAIFEAVLVSFGAVSSPPIGEGSDKSCSGVGSSVAEDVFFRGDFPAAREWRRTAAFESGGGACDSDGPSTWWLSPVWLGPLLWVWFCGIMTGYLVFERLGRDEVLNYCRIEVENARAVVQHEENKALREHREWLAARVAAREAGAEMGGDATADTGI